MVDSLFSFVALKTFSWVSRFIFALFNFEPKSVVNDVLKYKGMEVYVKREDLNLDSNDYLLEDVYDVERGKFMSIKFI